MERTREHLKGSKPDPAWKDLVDTVFELFQRAGKSTKQAASPATQDTVTVVNSVPGSLPWGRITRKPTTFPPDPHSHEELDPVFGASPAAEITADHVDAMNEMLLDRRAWGGEWGYIWENP